MQYTAVSEVSTLVSTAFSTKWNMSQLLPYCVAIVALFFLKLSLSSQHRSTNPAEPGQIQPRPWYIGHMTGMISRHTHYFNDLSKTHGVDIAILPMPLGKIYAIWDIHLIQSALRSSAMSFDAIMMQHARGLLGLNERCLEVARTGMLRDLMRLTTSLLSGRSLATISVDFLNHAAPVLNELGARPTYCISDFYDWVQTIATLATTDTLYGELNPFRKDEGLLVDVWLFEAGLRRLAMNIFPAVTARRPSHARDRLVRAITPLFDETISDQSLLPTLTLKRVEVIRSHGITDPEQVARIELALLHGATVNTVPTLFWTLTHVLACPELVRDIRREARTYIQPGAEIVVPFSVLSDSSPLLMSVFRETTRLVNSAMSTRFAMKDALIADEHGREYLIRSGSTVMMPATAHLSTDVWGSDAAEFKSTRFYGWDSRDKPEIKKRRAAYMPFGGGKHLCPGRNLAQYEILGMVLAMVMAFDVEDAHSPNKPVQIPQLDPARMGQGVGKPTFSKPGNRLAAKLSVRTGWENARWRFTV
ncbi:hypothetical protein PFICI_10196 [Pestalotiopsis fici W106-1]|uniref:Uncharacterized protein n=1 Tax=Pestalotiopsis fici (strain W106-1 / CGMCC3.15140) TaxID=1229662 RepID=W3WWF2_PESFW|nr:uncharacterized protein PFICI_10196 [Pestalotiopsis fici W106-1]ETS78134.1 hypothetical protein PFICI_10196 [Pestalotiopsis fici W106-1]